MKIKEWLRQASDKLDKEELGHLEVRKAKIHKRLSWCNICKESSVVIKVYIRKKDNTLRRIEYCLNHCKYSLDTTPSLCLNNDCTQTKGE